MWHDNDMLAETTPSRPRPLTRDDCRALEAAGLLDLKRHELLDGYLIPKIGRIPPHSFALHRLQDWLREVFGPHHVEQGATIDPSPLLNATNWPDPDAIVLSRPSNEFRAENPGPPDLLLVAEVSAITQDLDLGAKAALYATAGIPEYWVLDLAAKRIVVHRDPIGNRYASILAYAADEAVSPLAAESASIRLNDLTN